MVPIAIPSDEALLLDAYYSAWSSKWVDQAQLGPVLNASGPTLWIGSYFDLAMPWADSSWVILDQDIEMLAIGRKKLRKAQAVQGDIRQLPFSGCFDKIVSVGAVTAYLLDSAGIARAARALRVALAKKADARILIDAYDIETIRSAGYFGGWGLWHFNDRRFTHRVEMHSPPNENGIFLATLTVAEPDAGTAKHFQFYQRAFSSRHLARAFQSNGLRLTACHVDPCHGRVYHTYACRY